MKNNLFISSNALTTIISSLIIDENYKSDNNILLIVANHLETKFLDSMIDVAKRLECFNKILLFNEYSESMKLNCTVTLKDAKTFDFKRFEKDAEINNIDKIYTTFLYVQARTIISHYTTSQVCAIENGTASYLPQQLEKELAERIVEFYSFNYFNILEPAILKSLPKIKNVVIDKIKIKEKFEKLSHAVDIEQDENSVIFCAHNLSLNKNLMSEKEEFDEYYNIIKTLIAKGYDVYFKEHPKTPAHFYNKFRSQLKTNKLHLIKTPYPVEIIIPKLKPKAIVSVFSSSLLTVPHIFEIPSHTFKIKNNLTKYPVFEMAYAMILSYIAQLDKPEPPPITNWETNVNPLTIVIFVEALKMFISKKDFLQIQKNIQTIPYEEFEYFNISKELYEVYKYGSYIHLLIHYTNPYLEHIKKNFNSLPKKEFISKTLKTMKSMI